jgi:thymidylate kinase
MLKIKIEGLCGSGKTTIATLVEKALKEHGLKCEVIDNSPGTHNFLDYRIQELIMKQEQPIEILTVPIK